VIGGLTLYNLSVRPLVLLPALLAAGLLQAENITTVLLNGKILTVDPKFSTAEAVAIRDGRIVATGPSADLRKLAGGQGRLIDLEGRTVIPGLIDSHMHAIRAALSFSTEVNWIGARSLAEALDRIHEASHSMPPGAWLIVAGGWNVQQFRENRRPTQAELVAAAPENPVYVQLGYGWAVMTPKAIEKLHIANDADLPAGGKLERDADGKLTGGISGAQNAIIALFDRLPVPTPEQEVEGTKKFFRELNRLGLTGVVDPGGNNMTPESYQALFKVWRGGELTVRVAYSLCGITPGKEFEELKDLTQLVPMGFGDAMLRFNGIGERITWAKTKQQQAHRSRARKVLRDRALGRRAWHVAHYALAAGRLRRSLVGHLRAREQRSADREPAMVHRALERRLAPEPAAHAGAGSRLDRSARQKRAARGDCQRDRRSGGRGHRCASRGILQSIYRLATVCGRQHRTRRGSAALHFRECVVFA
jgi:predicted amidohydrolase YtcJ